MVDAAKEIGWHADGLDINPYSARINNFIYGNFEQDSVYYSLQKYDVIYTSHVFEHFKDPVLQISRCYDLLNDNGILMVIMPDPWFINHNHPTLWCHWHIKEHHIMWDMDSFINKAIEKGFKSVYAKRNSGIEFFTLGDYHLVFQK